MNGTCPLFTENGMDLQIIEKDWWVTTVLKSLFALPYAEHISFKGGTNLSKCWGLIQRMSEDIAIDREYLGYGGKLSRMSHDPRNLRGKRMIRLWADMFSEVE